MVMFVCLELLAPRAWGQDLPGWNATSGGAKAPPMFGVMDEDQFFNKNSGALKRVSDKLRKLEADHGHRIYLVIELAAELFRTWIPDGNGMVIVFESGSRRMGIGRDLAGRPEDPSGNSWQIPSNETSAMLARAREATDNSLLPSLTWRRSCPIWSTNIPSIFCAALSAPPLSDQSK
jgi:hypothetical protein